MNLIWSRRMGKLGLLAAVLLGGVPVGKAAVVYSGLKDIAIPTDLDGVYLDLNTGNTSTSSFAGWDINPFYGGYAIANSPTFQPGRSSTAVDAPVLNLGLGTSSGPSAFSVATSFAGSVGHLGNGAGQFVPGTEGYLGFQFDPGGSLGTYYGWMRVVLTANAAGGWIRDWAYDTSGAPITVGYTGLTPVPEPSEWAAVGVGVLGLAWLAKTRWTSRRR